MLNLFKSIGTTELVIICLVLAVLFIWQTIVKMGKKNEKTPASKIKDNTESTK